MRTVTFRPKTNTPHADYGSCPRCGAYWWTNDEPFGLLADGRLNFPNRQKVDNHWKCYNPDCTAGYYDPDLNRVVEDKPSPERLQQIREQATRQVAEMLHNKIWISQGNAHRPWPKDDPIPEGWSIS